MIREIFVPLLSSRSDVGAVESAIALAGALDAHVSALVTIAHPLPMVTEMGYLPAEIGQQQLEQARADAAALAAGVRERFASAGISGEVRITDTIRLWSEQTAALHARHADLSILGGPDPADGTGHFSLDFDSLLLQTGRPVLLVPAGTVLAVPPRKAVIAWKPTREAARALHDALPLLPEGAQVDVLMIDPQVGEGGHGEQPGADVARHLARHRLSVNVVALPGQGRSEGDNVLRYTEQAGADLLVMGGYGHSRWREVVLGGVTAMVLRSTRTPVLFSH